MRLEIEKKSISSILLRLGTPNWMLLLCFAIRGFNFATRKNTFDTPGLVLLQ